jgi:membrane-associated phospholipid phosphatase
VVVICSVILVAVLGALFAHHTRADSFDRAVDAPIISLFSNHGNLAYHLAFPGTLRPAIVLSGIMVVICLLTGRLNGAVLALAAVPVADGLDDGLIKHLVGRTYFGQLTYPSGHTTAAFAIVTTIAIVFLIPPQPYGARLMRVLIAEAGVGVGVIVAMAVIALQWHTFTDTLAGAAVGVGAVCALALILDLFQRPPATPAHYQLPSEQRSTTDAEARAADEKWLAD